MARLIAGGVTDSEIARITALPRSTVREWRTKRPWTGASTKGCAVCGHPAHDPDAWAQNPSYAYLFGLYLGDGMISQYPRTTRLRVFLDQRYTGILDACEEAMLAVLPTNSVCRIARVGCFEIASYSKQWPCLFPQCGKGPKHERRIVLHSWQQDAVGIHTEAFLRGLIHSDGCRSMNTVHWRDRTYSYPRYQFTNRSDDIRGLFTDACDRLEIPWRHMNAWNISVARREGVARLDEFIGPKR